MAGRGDQSLARRRCWGRAYRRYFCRWVGGEAQAGTAGGSRRRGDLQQRPIMRVKPRGELPGGHVLAPPEGGGGVLPVLVD